MSDVPGTVDGPFPGTVRIPERVWVHPDGHAYVGRSPGTVPGVDYANGKEWRLEVASGAVMTDKDARAKLKETGLDSFEDVTDYAAILEAAKAAGATVSVGKAEKVAGRWRVAIVGVPASEVTSL